MNCMPFHWAAPCAPNLLTGVPSTKGLLDWHRFLDGDIVDHSATLTRGAIARGTGLENSSGVGEDYLVWVVATFGERTPPTGEPFYVLSGHTCGTGSSVG